MLRGEDLNFENMMRCCRNGAIHFWESYLKRILPKSQQEYINECIYLKIKSTYPDPNRNYRGYEYTIEHLERMLRLEKRHKEESWSDLEREDEEDGQDENEENARAYGSIVDSYAKFDDHSSI